MAQASSDSTNYAIPPRPIPAVPVAQNGSDNGQQQPLVFPVHRIYCVARNYADHAREMGEDPSKEPPCFFAKPADAVVACDAALNAKIPYPPDTRNLQYEMEIVVALKVGGSNIAVEHAAKHIYGFAVGVDLTRRDLQSVAKNLGRPWCAAKGFDRSAPIGNIVPLATTSETILLDPEATLWLDVNGERRQTGTPSQMIWDIPHVISILSQSFELQPGDLIFTGTPAGVGPLEKGDCVKGGMKGLGELAFTII